MTMITMKFGLTLIILASLAAGIGSAGFISDPTPLNYPDWPGFSSDEWNYEINPFGYSTAVNLSEMMYPKPTPVVPEESPIEIELVPLVMPKPLSISKEELFSSITTISQGKQSLLASHKSTSLLSLF